MLIQHRRRLSFFLPGAKDELPPSLPPLPSPVFVVVVVDVVVVVVVVVVDDDDDDDIFLATKTQKFTQPLQVMQTTFRDS